MISLKSLTVDKSVDLIFAPCDKINLLNDAITILNQMRFCTVILCKLMTDSFPSNFTVPASQILQLVSNMCSINWNDIKNQKSLDSMTIGLIIPKIHEYAFDILEALILWYYANYVLLHKFLIL